MELFTGNSVAEVVFMGVALAAGIAFIVFTTVVNKLEKVYKKRLTNTK
jgi:hypothetical protein